MKAHELLSDESKWTQKALARNSKGDYCFEQSPDAVQWCTVGAIYKCYRKDCLEAFDKLSDNIESLGFAGIPSWNDTNDYQTVYNKLKELDI